MNGINYVFCKDKIYNITYILKKFHYELICVESDDCYDITFSTNKEHKLYLWDIFYSPEDIRLKKLKSL